MSRRLTTEDFIERAKKVHGNKYDYSKTEYVDSITSVCIICPIHGEFFQLPKVHISLKSIGCPACYIDSCGNKTKRSWEEVRNELLNIYGDKFDFSSATYIDTHTKIGVFCNSCGEYFIKRQTAYCVEFLVRPVQRS